MSDAWYYAQGDEEKGPVPTAELKSMRASGKLKPDDLVWKDGMADWAPASTVPGLFAEPPGSRPTPPPGGRSGSIPVNSPQGSERFKTLEPAAAPTVATRRPLLSSLSLPMNLTQIGKMIATPVLLMGLLIVVWAKGCDTLGTRYVARVAARASIAESEFDQERAALIATVQNDHDELTAIEDPKASEQLEIEKAKEKLDELNDETNKLKTRLERGEWARLRGAAKNAADNNAMWAYYREMAFVFGSMILVIGLLGLAYTGDSAERWISYIMLAIITFSLYVGGFAFFQP